MFYINKLLYIDEECVEYIDFHCSLHRSEIRKKLRETNAKLRSTQQIILKI